MLEPISSAGDETRLRVFRRAVEAEAQERAAARRLFGDDGAAVRLGDLAHDREAEARARKSDARRRRGRSGRRRAARSSGAMPGPWSRTRSSPCSSRDVDDRAAARSTCPRSRAGSRRRARAAPGRRRPVVGSSARLERHLREARAGALDGLLDELVELHLVRSRRASSPRASSSRPPIRSRISCASRWRSANSRSRASRVEPVLLLQHVDVRLHARQRRTQLVRGVGDEAALRLDRVLECREHRVERRAESRELAAAGPSGTRSLGSRVRAIRSAAAVSRSTGARVARDDERAGERRRADAVRATRAAG